MANFSRMRLGTLLGAVAATACVIFAVFAEHASGLNLIPEDLGRGLYILAALGWFGHIAAVCRDDILQRLNQLDTGINDYGDRRETDGQLAGMRRATDIHPQRPRLVE